MAADIGSPGSTLIPPVLLQVSAEAPRRGGAGGRHSALWWRAAPGSVALLIAATLVLRLLFAAALGLGMDESYMVAAGRGFRLGYFDHPPIAWWLAWLGAHLAGTEAPLAVRLPFVLLFALSTWLMYRLATVLFDRRAGLWAAMLFNAVPVLGITAGSWVLPDGPLIAALLGAVLCLVYALPARAARAWGWWLGCGLCFGIALCSKYTAVLLGGGVGLYLVTAPDGRAWLTRPQPYAAALLALAVFSPVLIWNADHGWASLMFQGARATGGRWHPFGPITTLGGEALFFIPWLWLGLAMCAWSALRRGPAEWRGWLLVCLALPTLAAFEVISLRTHVLYHWAAPGEMMLLPLLGAWIARHAPHSRALRRCVAATSVALLLAVVLIGTEVRFNWLPDLFEDFALGHDPDLDAVDWTSLRVALAARGDLRPGVVIGATRWHDAGKIDYALRGEVPVICLGLDPREYGVINPARNYLGQKILIVAPRETLSSLAVGYARYFDRIETLPPVMLLHAGRPAMVLPLFEGYGLHMAAAPHG